MTAQDVDLNLLRVLDALLEEGSVAGAAARLHLSAPAVSRSLGRLRRALDDPLFVRSGRMLVPTPRAESIRQEAKHAFLQATAVLRPDAEVFDPSQLHRRFVICAGDAIIAALGLSLVDRVVNEAPGVDIDFLPDTNERELLRSANVDLDIGAPHVMAPEIESEVLFTDRFVLAFGSAHRFATQTVTARRFANARHIIVSTKGKRSNLVDVALADLGLRRDRVTVVPSAVVAAHLVADSDAVVTLPSAVVSSLGQHLSIVASVLPFATPSLPVGQSWHIRYANDPAHQWLRSQVAAVAIDRRLSDGVVG